MYRKIESKKLLRDSQAAASRMRELRLFPRPNDAAVGFPFQRSLLLESLSHWAAGSR